MKKSEDPTASDGMTSSTLAEFMTRLKEPSDAEIKAMAEIGRQPGATGLNSAGKLVTAPKRSL